MGEIEMQFNNAAGFGRQKFTCKVSRSGDLLHTAYLAAQLPHMIYPPMDPQVNPPNPQNWLYHAGTDYVSWVNAVGHAMLLEASINIGAHEYDSHMGEYLEMWESLSAPSDRLLSEMTGRYANMAACASASLLDQQLYIPLRFWFNRFASQSLPLVALYWHDVELQFATRPIDQLYVTSGNLTAHVGGANPAFGDHWVRVPDTLGDMHILANFVYLDRTERAAFANSKSEYVIDQVQFLGADTITATSTSVTHSIRFNHPVQELIWAIRRNSCTAANDWFNFDGNLTDNTVIPDALVTDPFRSAQILLNNNDRTPDMPAIYFRTVQPYQFHSRIPAADRYVYCYNFGLQPEEMLDTGSVNASRFDNMGLRITYNGQTELATRPPVDGQLFVFGRSRNVMKVTVGMSGMKFAA